MTCLISHRAADSTACFSGRTAAESLWPPVAPGNSRQGFTGRRERKLAWSEACDCLGKGPTGDTVVARAAAITWSQWQESHYIELLEEDQAVSQQESAIQQTVPNKPLFAPLFQTVRDWFTKIEASRAVAQRRTPQYLQASDGNAPTGPSLPPVLDIEEMRKYDSEDVVLEQISREPERPSRAVSDMRKTR